MAFPFHPPGNYAMSSGPSYETPSEVLNGRKIGTPPGCIIPTSAFIFMRHFTSIRMRRLWYVHCSRNCCGHLRRHGVLCPVRRDQHGCRSPSHRSQPCRGPGTPCAPLNAFRRTWLFCVLCLPPLVWHLSPLAGRGQEECPHLQELHSLSSCRHRPPSRLWG